MINESRPRFALSGGPRSTCAQRIDRGGTRQCTPCPVPPELPHSLIRCGPGYPSPDVPVGVLACQFPAVQRPVRSPARMITRWCRMVEAPAQCRTKQRRSLAHWLGQQGKGERAVRGIDGGVRSPCEKRGPYVDGRASVLNRQGWPACDGSPGRSEAQRRAIACQPPMRTPESPRVRAERDCGGFQRLAWTEGSASYTRANGPPGRMFHAGFTQSRSSAYFHEAGPNTPSPVPSLRTLLGTW